MDLQGCDSLVATASATADGSVLFAKNSDRHADECQHLRIYPAREYEPGETVRCQYLTLPQARRTHRVLGSQPFWLWGFEHGINEHGVAIGNEAIWTKAPRAKIGLLGMDLIRLGLERGATAREALDVMTALLEEHGQGGSPRHHDASAPCYDSSFILADAREAWVLETSGHDWVAERVDGVRSISNIPSIGSEFDLASPGLRARSGLDFARDLGDYEAYPQTSGATRCARSRSLLQKKAGSLRPEDMMAFLRDHGGDPGWAPAPENPPTICVHPGPAITAASMVAQLRPEGFRVWCSLVSPCISVFLPVSLDADIPSAFACGEASFTSASAWWRLRRILDRASEDWQRHFPRIRARWDDLERESLASPGLDLFTRFEAELRTIERELGVNC